MLRHLNSLVLCLKNSLNRFFKKLLEPVVVRSVKEKLDENLPVLEYLIDSVPHRKAPSVVYGSCRDVALAMNMANNFYNFVSAARRCEWDAELVLWPDVFDCNVFADPRWEVEDLDLTSTPGDFSRSILTSGMPEGVIDILTDIKGRQSDWIPGIPRAEPLLNQWVGYRKALPYLRAFRRHQILLASGPAIAMAPFADMPYVTFPSGGDLYITPFESSILGRLMRAGWKRAHAHIFSGAHFYRFAEDLGLRNIAYIPILIDTVRYAPLTERESCREKELQRLQCDRLFFVGSRHDWGDKGTGKIISAIEALKGRTSVRFKVLMSSWGKELEKTKKAIVERGLTDVCQFLPALSKSRLRYWMSVSDAVLDQFNIGEYGTLTLESMAVGRPSILYYAHRNKLPILKAHTAEEIMEQMLWVLQNPFAADALGVQAREWVSAHHGPDAVLPQFDAVFRSVLNNEAIPEFPPVMEA